MRFAAFSLVMLASAALAESDPSKPPEKIVSVFGPGEQTTYEVSYLGITAGKAEITVGWEMEHKGRTVWPLVCVGETNERTSQIYKIKDRFVSYWDPAAREAIGADFFVNESKHRAKERFNFDLEANTATVVREAPGWPTTERHYQLEEGTVDLAAAGFFFRNLKLVPGESHLLPVFTGNRAYKMRVTVVGKETLKTGLGELEVYRVTFNGEFSGQLAAKGLLTIFYTTDEKQLPVRAEAKLALGSVKIDAVKYEAGRRYTGAN
jgi:hypothetical protein